MSFYFFNLAANQNCIFCLVLRGGVGAGVEFVAEGDCGMAYQFKTCSDYTALFNSVAKIFQRF